MFDIWLICRKPQKRHRSEHTEQSEDTAPEIEKQGNRSEYP